MNTIHVISNLLFFSNGIEWKYFKCLKILQLIIHKGFKRTEQGVHIQARLMGSGGDRFVIGVEICV